MKYVFIMFQGSKTNLKKWNEYTESKFLDKLKSLGDVYIFQDAIHNIEYYNKDNPLRKDYDSYIHKDLNYVNIDTYIDILYKDIKKKYDRKIYKYIPLGYSAGGYLALYFSQKYNKDCHSVVLLDSLQIHPSFIKKRLKELGNYDYVNQEMYYNIINDYIKHPSLEKRNIILDIHNYIRTSFISKYLKPTFNIPIFSFINIESEKDEKYKEINYMKKYNKQNYYEYIFFNKTHYIFNKKREANKIISILKKNIF